MHPLSKNFLESYYFRRIAHAKLTPWLGWNILISELVQNPSKIVLKTLCTEILKYIVQQKGVK